MGKMNPSSKSIRYLTIILIILVALFLLQRFGVILFGYSHISHPGIDEPVSGVLACDLLDRQIRGPLFVYEYLNRSGDVLIEGLSLVTFFKVFGRSIFSTKVFALSSAFLSLLCWIIFIKRYQGIWAAIIFTALFAFPPPMFARLNLIGTISSHHMINPLIAMQLLILFRIIVNDENKPALWLWLGLGFFSGLGAYTFYTHIIFVGFCFVFLLIFKSAAVTVRRIALLGVGFGAGFSPWIIRSVQSRTGGHYLASMLKNIAIDIWSFIQTFGFNVPHSLGYAYPSRDIGIISILFALSILFFAGVLLKSFLQNLFLMSGKLKARLEKTSPSILQGLFVGAFPIFFLSCLSLSPLHVYPFEYWPTIGLFATFPPSDVIRYRWLHVLFPFYLAIVAIGSVTLFTTRHKIKFHYTLLTIFILISFSFFGFAGSIKLYSKKDFGRIFYYKGYNYDQFAPKFILGEFAYRNVEDAKAITVNYPEEHKGDAYRCLGTLLTQNLIKDSNRAVKLEQSLEEVPKHYLRDFIYGVVRAAQNIPEKEFKPFTDIVVSKYPNLFYENWGFRHLGYKYYSVMINQEVLFKNIPSGEKWFFKNFLDKFKHEIKDNGRWMAEKNLLQEISMIPPQHQHEVIKGVGMLVGAEMLFDTLHAPDYPLDSRFGEKFSGSLREAFYEGVGSGFAETLCRFWRMLLLPKDISSPLYREMLEIEWERCQTLMSMMSPVYYPLIEKGFLRDLESRHFSQGIQNYLNNKFERTENSLFQRNISSKEVS
ncbi:MAG: hypothetical protein NT096_12435 [Proteobacteria bacterium]|nr:hypothetical protein [Pseudomonadota bacterium]